MKPPILKPLRMLNIILDIQKQLMPTEKKKTSRPFTKDQLAVREALGIEWEH